MFPTIDAKPLEHLELPSGYLTVRHGIDGPFIDGLPGFTEKKVVIFHGYVK